MCEQQRLSRVCAQAIVCYNLPHFLYIIVRNQVYFTLIPCKVKKKNTEYLQNVYENINSSFFENKKSSDSVLKFLIARLQWI